MLTPPNDERDALCEIYYLTQEITKDWRKLVKYGETLDLETKRKVLWVWPTELDLWHINQLLRKYSVMNVLSIGCGSGLFEWFLKESHNLNVCGLEVDRKWWQSNYAIKTFIPINYVEDMKTDSLDSFLQQCCVTNSWNFALMFCYFNHRLAFLKYLKSYRGNYIIIVGPFKKDNVYSDPLPLEPNFPDDLNEKWILAYSLPMKNNILVLYEKCTNPI